MAREPPLPRCPRCCVCDNNADARRATQTRYVSVTDNVAKSGPRAARADMPNAPPSAAEAADARKATHACCVTDHETKGGLRASHVEMHASGRLQPKLLKRAEQRALIVCSRSR